MPRAVKTIGDYESDYGICKCGCDGELFYRGTGGLNRFLPGHGRRRELDKATTPEQVSKAILKSLGKERYRDNRELVSDRSYGMVS